jgi:hypothetical protein
MVVHQNMPDDVAYQITKLMFEKREEWGQVHKEALSLDLKNQNNVNTPVPYHPGAVRYYKEKGIAVK